MKSLYELVAFEANLATDDGGGGVVGAFGEQFRTRASYTRLRGGEGVLAARLEGRQPTVIRVRRFSRTRSVTTDWRIRDVRTDEIFNIRTIVETDDRLWLDMTAESGVAT